ncbi:MAG TPA: histone deacetylase family protein [Rhizomicrobium sp.]|jgi:acetoin utilization deacetylase AcuC-like enzyme
MTTALLTHPACLNHEPPPGHPESPARLAAVLEALSDPEFGALARLEAPAAARSALIGAHAAQQVARLLDEWAPLTGTHRYVRVDPDTAMSAGSAEAALRAAGACVRAVDEVMGGRSRNAFCAVRPPGHHAERARAMGFCLFNSIAVAAHHARVAHGCKRVAIVDFDVHHGNGTQDIFWNDPDTLYASTHEFPYYPGTGAADERGASGNIVNVPLPAGAGSEAFRTAYRDVILPAVEQFRPDFLFISAGFDAHAADPLADLRLTEADFSWITRELCAVAARCCDGRVVSTLEGGYDLDALAASAAAHVRALMEA